MKTYLFAKSHLLFLLFCSCLFLAASCNSDDDLAPFSANEPHTVFYCKINGMDWTPAGGDLFSGYPFDLDYYSDTGGLELIASNSLDNATHNGAIHMLAKNVEVGNNPLIDNESSHR